MSKILISIPIKTSLNPILTEKIFNLVSKFPIANPGHEITVMFDFESVVKDPLDAITPWMKVYKARNTLLAKVDLKLFDYFLWIDADVIDFPLDMPSRLIAGNPDGVSAPMVLIEGRTTFYDYTAFVIKGQDNRNLDNRQWILGRNLTPHHPYWPAEPKETVVELDCVGTVTMVPSWIYQNGVRYTNHLTFTDHHPICLACREAGKKVTVDRSIIAYHADLPKYGEQWH
jgi:hypothetical protein